MSNRKLQEFDEHVYGPRSVLRPGDRFRVSGGPAVDAVRAAQQKMGKSRAGDKSATKLQGGAKTGGTAGTKVKSGSTPVRA